jgi:hypothetical protein
MQTPKSVQACVIYVLNFIQNYIIMYNNTRDITVESLRWDTLCKYNNLIHNIGCLFKFILKVRVNCERTTCQSAK